ncbi:S8 family serine peptidase [Klenkia sp. LSe6-5]|uniref:S8 family serine peptidase n=1 Tax=Klenkia sesuvii TaxID=3103137 RepID=A0ABU8DVW8_9ACTN
MLSRTTTTPGQGRHRVLARGGIVAVAAALTMTGGAGLASAAPADVAARAGQDPVSLSPDQLRQVQDQVSARLAGDRPAGLPASGPASFFVETATPSTSEVYTQALPGGEAAAGAAAAQAQPAAEAAAAQVAAEVPAAVPAAEVLYTTSTVLSGVAVRADAADYDALVALPDVVAVHPITPKQVSNTGAASVVQAVQAWQDLGNTGAGVSIGIIDTGIDYTHTDFGGSGSVDQFDTLQSYEAQPAPAGVFPNAKVVGGYDFVGDSYDADPTSPSYQPVAMPDPNPLDCNGHGTHVAGTSAGYGVNADGSTYRGGYTDGVPGDLRIGPGMAPEADLYALKVFGCDGSTDVTMQAIEWALDPNSDGDPSDHLDVVNLSLGSDYGLADDADSLAIDRAMQLGMLTVLAAGNAGDSYDIGGSPGNAPRGIGVAASNDGYGVFDGWQVTAPAGLVDGTRPGLRSIAYSDVDEAGATEPDVTGDLLLPPAGNESACAPLPAGYADGRILLIEADGFTCGSVAKGTNATDAGATGFLIIGDDDLLETGITGVAAIPGILVPATDGAALRDAVAGGQSVTVTFGPSLKDASTYTDPEQVDLLASFSSRGVRQEDGAKPDVTAPGVTLFSAGVGQGSGGASLSGTSMATPVTAGVTALVRAAHPEWTTEEVKADLMNTATHDLYTGPGQTGDRYGPNRVGAGRIDAAAALRNEVLAYAEAGSGVVTASFGVVEVDQEQVSATKTITVANKGGRAAVYRVSYDALVDQPGVQYALSAQRLTVPPGQSRTVTVTMTATQDQLLKVADPTVVTDDGRQFLGEASGRVVLAPTNNRGEVLRVPVHANPKPASTLQASPSEDGSTLTLTLTGEGVANGDLFDPTSYTSLVSGFEQLGTSPEMPKCAGEPASTCYKSELERSVDLAAVGVASDARQYRDAGLYFAVASHGTETTPLAPISTSIVLDATGDGVWDYLVTTTSITDYDLPLVVVADRDGNLVGPGGEPYVAPLNLYDGLVDTNVFDSDVKVFGVPLSALPEVTGRITFGVQSTSYTGTVDDVGTVTSATGQVELAQQAMSFDPTAPGLSFTSDGETALVVPATDGTQLAVTQDAASYAADTAVGGDKGAMVVLHQNSGAAGRYQSVPVAPGAGADATSTGTTAPPADTTPVEPTTPPDQQVTEPPAPPASDAPEGAPAG